MFFPTLNVGSYKDEIPSQYKYYKGMFEKNNANTLSKHQLYDYKSDLEEGEQLQFGPIYNLL